MSGPDGRPVPGAAVVCLKPGHVLLVQRDREPNRGRWSYPGGRIEPGETARAAAAREAQEETGLRVRVLDVVDVYDALFPPYHYVVADYLAVPEDETDPVPGTDVSAARWVPFADIPAYDLTREMECVLARARWLLEAGREAPPSLGMGEWENGGMGVWTPVPPFPHSPIRTHSPLTTHHSPLTGLYLITDATLVPGRGHVECAWGALAGGARVIQLRDKHRDAGELLPVAREIAALCREAGALFLVNDRVDLAVAAGADGVHLGQTDLPVREARVILGPGKWIGVSVEDVEQVRRAEADGADYLGVGAIYGSATKLDAGGAVGPEQIRRFRAVSRLPIVAIGGITLERVPEVMAAGADSVAVISAVVAAADPAAAARELADRIIQASTAP